MNNQGLMLVSFEGAFSGFTCLRQHRRKARAYRKSDDSYEPMQAEQHVGTAQVIPRCSPCSVLVGQGIVKIARSDSRREQRSSAIRPVKKL